jgi:hypothetical protein
MFAVIPKKSGVSDVNERLTGSRFNRVEIKLHEMISVTDSITTNSASGKHCTCQRRNAKWTTNQQPEAWQLEEQRER